MSKQEYVCGITTYNTSAQEAVENIRSIEGMIEVVTQADSIRCISTDVYDATFATITMLILLVIGMIGGFYAGIASNNGGDKSWRNNSLDNVDLN